MGERIIFPGVKIMTRSVLRVLSFFLGILGILFMPGCVTIRSDFISIGEEELFSEDFGGNLFAWNIETRIPGQYEQVKEETKPFFRFLGIGEASVESSLVSNFRMEFEVRLEAPVEYNIATAMINFRSYFNKRYCLVLEPYQTRLTVARIKLNELKEIAARKTPLELKKWYKYEIVAVGNNLKVFKNDILIIDIQDEGSTIDQGNIWFESHSRYSFTNVKISKLGDFQKIEREKVEKPLEEKIILQKEKLTLAISDFENLGVASYEVSLLVDLYSYSLLSTGVFRVVERKELKKILAEQELQLSDLTEEEGAVQVGHLLNAEYLSTGSFGRIGEEYIISLKLIKVETGETVINAKKSFRNPEEIPNSIKSLSEEIAAKIGSP